MNCPRCGQASLVETLARSGVLVDNCSICKGVWLDRGEILQFSRRPVALERALADSAALAATSPPRSCPRCQAVLERTSFLEPNLLVDRCPECEGYWFDEGVLARSLSAERRILDPGSPLDAVALSALEPEPLESSHDEAAHARMRDLASGLLPLPNLLLRSAGMLFLLYGFVGLILIALAQLDVITPLLAVGIGAAFIVLQYLLGPWLMDLSLRWIYKFSWISLDQLPPHLGEFVRRVTAENQMKTPQFGLIHDGAPNAFTYGRHPGDMRIVITQGILDLLEPAEIEAVVAHEIGHGKNWDMALMTIVQLVPLLLYFLYRTALSAGDRGKNDGYRFAVAAGAYILYIVSEYVVLWFSRCREYYADRFAGAATGDPSALASALVKIGYGLASRGQEAVESADASAKKKKTHRQSSSSMLDAVGAMGIFDRRAAVAMVASSAGAAAGNSSATRASAVSKENLKSAMQWDLWNPWATFYELNSTHPLIAHRLEYLADQAAAMGREPFIVFDRKRPESYWDEFLVDLAVMLLPALLLTAGLALAGCVALAMMWGLIPGATHPDRFFPLMVTGLPVLGLGVGMLIKTWLSYRADYFAPLTVAGLLHKVKVSSVRPVPARMRGTIIGRGVPGLIWSSDFVMRDETGILFLDYRQPLAIWEWLFGLLRAGEFTGKKVEAVGWFRRSPLPYLELKSITVDGVTRNSYARHARYVVAVILALAGIGLVVLGAAAGIAL